MMNQRLNGRPDHDRVHGRVIITLAYPRSGSADMVGPPDWASREYYEVRRRRRSPPDARGSLSDDARDARGPVQAAGTPRAARRAVVRSRGCAIGWEAGPKLVAESNDCEAVRRRGVPRRAAARAGPAAPPPAIRSRCAASVLFVGLANGARGELTLDTWRDAQTGSGPPRREQDRLTGCYRVNLTSTSRPTRTLHGRTPTCPSCSRRVREQLGLRWNRRVPSATCW
jgi:hypothetical protein